MKSNLKGKKFLVTYGPTWVAIDDMRVISNRSSGMMGKLIVDDLVDAGATVVALEGPISDPLINKNVQIKKFTFFDEFEKFFTVELKKKYDVVIHAAAVSDFRPATKNQKKISSDKPLKLVLLPTEKLIQKIKHISPRTILVGFKLESTACQPRLKKEALESIMKNRCDLVVANSLTNGYNGFIFNKEGELLAQGKTRKEISKQLVKFLVRSVGA